MNGIYQVIKSTDCCWVFYLMENFIQKNLYEGNNNNNLTIRSIFLCLCVCLCNFSSSSSNCTHLHIIIITTFYLPRQCYCRHLIENTHTQARRELSIDCSKNINFRIIKNTNVYFLMQSAFKSLNNDGFLLCLFNRAFYSIEKNQQQRHGMTGRRRTM